MASSGRGVPAERAAAAANDLVEAREGAAALRAFLLQLDDQRAPWAQGVVDGVLNRLASAMAALDAGGAAAAGGQLSPAAGSGSGGGARPQQSVSSSGNTKKRSFSRRSQRPTDTEITSTLEDGHVWRKYGQKEIQNSRQPRSYYRCTHKSDQGCNAKRQVQACEADTSKYVVTYYGVHTCRDPSTIPLVVPDADAGAAPDRANNLISFGATTTNAAAASSSHQYLAMAADQLSTSWCASDDVFSFSSSAGSLMQVDELIGAVVGSAGVVTSTATVGSSAGLDRGGGFGGVAGGSGGGGGTGSFPPSPNGLGSFVVGSFGSVGGDDDDLFRMDP